MQKDISGKRLIDANDVFADIANVNLFNGEHIVHPNELEAIPTETSYHSYDGLLHPLTRDSLKLIKNLNSYIAFLGFEYQSDICNIMPVRSMGYDYSLYMEQIRKLTAQNRMSGRNAYVKVIHNAQKLLPVISVILYFGNEPWKFPNSLADILNFPTSNSNLWQTLIPDYPIHVISLRNQPEEIRQLYQSDFRIISEYLATESNRERLTSLMNNQQPLIHVEEVLDMLQSFSKDKRFHDIKEAYINLDNDKKGRCNTMCLLLDMCEEKGETKLLRLTSQLLQANRIQDLQRATEDITYLHQLYKEFSIE